MELDFERRCWAEIDLTKLQNNLHCIQKAAPHSEVMAVVKANAYGHGDVQAAQALDAAGADRFAVSGLVEALRLRRAGISKPILVLGYTSPLHTPLLAAHNIEQCVFSLEYAKELSAAADNASLSICAHYKVDTGMGRIGFNAKDDFDAAIKQLAEAYELPGLTPVGIFTHFAVADSISKEDEEYTRQQFSLFSQVRQALEKQSKTFIYAHCCNSAALIRYPEMQLDIVRPGIILYGCDPSPDVTLSGLQPAFSLQTVVTMVKTIKKGDQLGYGRTFTAPNDMKIATLAVGYADGYPRLLSNKGIASVNGISAPIIGGVCMDQLMVDVSHIPTVHLGSQATLFGLAGADTVYDVANKSGTVCYEVLCNIGRRVQRVYLIQGKATAITDYMEGEA